MKLNLGCGKDIRKGYVNCDYIKNNGVDKVIDLNKFPYPFKDNSVDEIIMQDIFEHLDKPIKCLEELYRISKKNTLIKIRVPHFSSNSAWADLTHKRAFASRVFDHFTSEGKTSSLEGKRKMNFKIIKKELQFPRLYKLLGFNKLFSHFIKIYEVHLYGFFPCSNIYFELKVIK